MIAVYMCSSGLRLSVSRRVTVGNEGKMNRTCVLKEPLH